MAIVRWNPFREIDAWQERINRLYNSAVARQGGEEGLWDYNWSPAVDIYEDNDSIKLFIELPGIKKEDIDIQITNNVLTLKGSRKFENEESKEKFHRIERFYGSFARSFTLHDKVQQDKISASYKDGVLTLTLPKAEEVKPKQIQVSIE